MSCSSATTSDTCDGVDGPMIESDPAGTAMYAVATIKDKASGCTDVTCSSCTSGLYDDGLLVDVMPDCRWGPAGCCADATSTQTCAASGIEQCPVTTHYRNNSKFVENHPSVAVNLCSHRALVVYGTTDNTIGLLVMRPDGNVQMTKQLAGSVDVGGQNTECVGLHGEVRACVGDTGETCGDPGQCVNVAKKPQVTVTSVGGRCYAGVSFAYTAGGPGNPFRVRRQIWDVTDDSSAGTVTIVRDLDDGNTWNEFSPEVVSSGPWVGFGFYNDMVGSCQVMFSVWMENILDSSKSFFIQNVDDHDFPLFGAGASGVDYQAGMSSPDSRGLVFGWNSPQCASSTATGCRQHCVRAAQSCTSGRWGNELRLGMVVPL